MMPHQSILSHRFLTLGWMFLPALVTNRIQFFEVSPISLIVVYSIMCIGVTLRELPWKTLKPVKTPVFNVESDEKSELFQEAFKATRYGLIIQYVGVAALTIDTIAVVTYAMITATGWSMLVTAIHCLLYIILLIVFAGLACFSPIHKAYIPNTDLRLK